jgi:hypothetical protein
MPKKTINQESIDAYILVAPLIILLAIFMLYPVLSNIYYSFTKWPGFGQASWIGLKNYQSLFDDSKFYLSLKNTGLLILYIPLATFLPLFLSAVLRDGYKGWAVYKALLYLPNVLGYVLLGILFNVFFREYGPFNLFLSSVGLDALTANWIGSSRIAIHMVGALFVVWSRVGFGCIYFLAAMSSMDSAFSTPPRSTEPAGGENLFSGNHSLRSIRRGVLGCSILRRGIRQTLRIYLLIHLWGTRFFNLDPGVRDLHPRLQGLQHGIRKRLGRHAIHLLRGHRRSSNTAHEEGLIWLYEKIAA